MRFKRVMIFPLLLWTISLAGCGDRSSAGSAEEGGGLAGASAVAANAAAGTTATGGGARGGNGGSGGAPPSCAGEGSIRSAELPARSEILKLMVMANDYFVAKWPDPTADIVTDRTRPSNLWTRAVYYEGLMALHAIDTDAARRAEYYDYAVRWGESPSHPWQLAYGESSPENPDNQCCGQTYIDLYRIDADPVRIEALKRHIDTVVSSSSSRAWTWIDAIQMAMPVFAKLGALTGESEYFEQMHALYLHTRDSLGLYNATDHLWWRDKSYKPPAETPHGRPVYWSRGNAWVFAGLTRALDAMPTSAPYRAQYLEDFRAMAGALGPIQRSDGFWNVSLADPGDYGGPETTGTALFVYGLAWGIRNGLLDAGVYRPMVARGWCALQSVVHTDSAPDHPAGFLGYVQGTGAEPSAAQPVTFDSTPNFEDFGLGCFLLGASEVWRLAEP